MALRRADPGTHGHADADAEADADADPGTHGQADADTHTEAAMGAIRLAALWGFLAGVATFCLAAGFAFALPVVLVALLRYMNRRTDPRERATGGRDA
jgi:hypothetical protein